MYRLFIVMLLCSFNPDVALPHLSKCTPCMIVLVSSYSLVRTVPIHIFLSVFRLACFETFNQKKDLSITLRSVRFWVDGETSEA